ncbi:MAG: Calx-beta domain-containing protein, partial [Planctomycetota bacterium]
MQKRAEMLKGLVVTKEGLLLLFARRSRIVCTRLTFRVFLFVPLVIVGSAEAFPLRVDIGDIGQPVKAGWQEFSGNRNNEIDPKTEVYLVNGRNISVTLRTGVLNDSGYRNYAGGDLGGDMLYPDNQYGPVNGSVILSLGNLAAGEYVLISHHNDSKDTHAQQDPIDVMVSGAVSAYTDDLEVVQTKSSDDSSLGQSSVTFTATGSGDVVVTYNPITSIPIISKAVLNGFELHTEGRTVQFDRPGSSGAEGVGWVYMAVTLSSPPEGSAVTVDYAATGGTATGGGVDYTLVGSSLSFEPGQTTPEYISIYLLNDGEPEEDETIEVTLSNPVNALLGANAQHIVTILDTSPTVGFDTAEGAGSESVSPAYVPVSLSRTWAETVTVDYNVTGGTATAGEDYSLSYGTLVFEPGEVTEFIRIDVVEDDIQEDPDETIEITLSNPSKARLGVNSRHTFVILPPVVQLCPAGDLDGDCKVDFNDLKLFSGQWLNAPNSCSGFECADLDGVNGVDMRDLALLADNWRVKVWPLVINEFMASNTATIADPQGDFDDWVEIYNGGPVDINMGGMWLADSDNWWQIPTDRPAETTIAPGGYLVIWVDSDEYHMPGLHASFKLSREDDAISLYMVDQATRIDGIKFRDQETDISYGRYPDAGDNLRFFATPTPGWANEGAYLGRVADTKFSHDRGFYDSPFTLSITCNTNGAAIHYTIRSGQRCVEIGPDRISCYGLGGSEPNEFLGGSTHLYTGPIDINQTTTVRAAAFKPGYLPTNVDTQTYIFLDDVLTQPSMDPCVVASYGAEVVKDALRSIPTLSLVMDENDFANLQDQDSLDPETIEELPASVELLYADPNEGEGVQINCGIEGHSWASCDGCKRSFRLEFKSEFGPAQLRYPFFESAPVNSDSVVDEFDRIILRASKNMPITYAGDQWTRDSQIAMSGTGSHGNYVHIYVNGEYWGMFNPVERPDAWFTSSYFGGDFDDYFATNHGIERGADHLSGDSARYDAMMTLAQERELDSSSKYEQFRELCDVQEFADYTVLFWFSGFGDNIDNNWYGGMRNNPLVGSIPPEGFMMFMWDAEYVFENIGGPPGNEEPWVPPYYFTMTGYTIVDVWLALFDNEDFRLLFADRVYKHCFNGGALTDENAQARWNAIVDHIDEAAICEAVRRSKDPNPEVVDMNGFVDIFINALRTWAEPAYPGINLYPDIDPPTFNQHGGHVAGGFGLTMTNPSGAGTIYYTLDGADPRAPGSGSPVGTPYGGAITLNQSRHVKARVYYSGEWSALNEATFAVGPVAD